MGDPIRGSAAGAKGGFEAAMETFKDAIGCGVEGSGGNVGDVEEGRKIGPKGGNKLGTAVESHGMGNTKTGNPSGAKGISTGTGGRGRKRNSLDPARGPINDGENVGMTLGGRKGSYKVNMYVGKTAGRNRNRSRWGRNVFVNLGSLATLEVWQGIHCLAQRLMSQAIPPPSQRKREVRRRRVARTPG